MTSAVLLSLALALVLGAGEAGAKIKCGKTIVKDVRLHNDLEDCPGDGLIIGADDITLDLNGHRIDGDNASATGVLNASVGGGDNVVVKGGGGGRITGFEFGVEMLSTSGSKVRGVAIKHSRNDGVLVNNSSDTVVKKNEITNTDGTGVSVTNSDDSEVVDNEINGPASSIFTSTGISVSATISDRNLVKGNSVRGGGDGDSGIRVFGGAQETRVRANLTRGLQQDGIEISNNADDTQVKKNESRRNAWGIQVVNTVGFGTDVIDNFAHDNDIDGIEIGFEDSSVGDNVALDNGQWGIEAVLLVDDLGGNKAAGNGQAQQCLNVDCDPP